LKESVARQETDARAQFMPREVCYRLEYISATNVADVSDHTG